MPRLVNQDYRSLPATPQRVKCVVVGDSGVGKTTLLITYVTNRFPTDYVPDVFSESYQEYHGVDGRIASLELWDAGIDDDSIRPLAYLMADVFIIDFSIGSLKSYESVRTMWAPELAFYGPPTTGVLLVGTKTDLRDEREVVEGLYNRHIPPPIIYQQGVALAKDIGALGYMECSARTPSGLAQVFDEAARIGLKHPANEICRVPYSLGHTISRRRRSASASSSGCVAV